MEKKEKTSVVIGITGGICTGKSSVLSVFRDLGHPVFSCDEEIKKLKKEDKNIILKIKKEFPGTERGGRRMAEIIFSSKEKKDKLEQILFPELEKKRKIFIEENKGKTVFIEVPLLYEKKKEKDYKKIIVTICSQETQKQRAITRGINIVLLEKILKNQMPILEKSKKADYVINTDENYNKMKANILDVYKQIEQER